MHIIIECEHLTGIVNVEVLPESILISQSDFLKFFII